MLKRFVNECPLPIINDNIHLGKKIGEGTSEVYQATVKDKDYAVKIYNSNIYDCVNDFYNCVLAECNILHKLQDTKQTISIGGVSCFENEDDDLTIYLFMEKMQVDLYDYIQDQSKFWISSRKKDDKFPTKYVVFNKEDKLYWCFTMSLSEKIKIMKSLLQAIVELHSKKIVHADLKPDNIAYHYDGKQQHIKLIDFDGSRYMKEYAEITIDRHLGTHGYRAPEQNEYKLSYKSDIYSVGVIIIELWNGDIWYEGEYFKDCRKEALYSLRKLEKIHPEFGKYLRRCIHMNPKLRPTALSLQKRMNELFP